MERDSPPRRLLGALLSRINILVIFFFKQKTAYEISSRDWSSDVCSSDLLVGSMIGRCDRQLAANREAAFHLGARGRGQHRNCKENDECRHRALHESQSGARHVPPRTDGLATRTR